MSNTASIVIAETLILNRVMSADEMVTYQRYVYDHYYRGANATAATLLRRAGYGGRKGRRAERRLRAIDGR